MNSTCGVVGYHVRFTRERSPVRTRAVAFFEKNKPYQGKQKSLTPLRYTFVVINDPEPAFVITEELLAQYDLRKRLIFKKDPVKG